MPAGLYLHFPFCLKKCRYCDFLSFPASRPERAAYLELLIQELALVIEKYERPRLTSVYIGGGTPSLLTTKELALLLGAVDKYCFWPKDIEVTLEANPGTVTQEQLKAVREMGVNRLSLGAQSFDDQELKKMGRVHTAAQISEAVNLARQAGFTNLNLDLIYGLPGQTLKKWQGSLENALALDPDHLSLYSLTLEPHTPWGRRESHLALPDEETVVQMYQTGRQMASRGGLRHYEISNFARPGYESKHNLGYWQNGPYLGLGLGAVSHLKGKRITNAGSFPAYQAALAKGRLPWETVEEPPREVRMAETIFLALRLRSGLDPRSFEKEFGVDFWEAYAVPVKKHVSLGLLEIKGNVVRLTAKGILISNEVFIDFLP